MALGSKHPRQAPAPVDEDTPPAPLTLTPGPSRPEPIRVERAFRLLRDTDHFWPSLVLASVLRLIPIAGPVLVTGWLVEIQRRLTARHPVPVPPFSLRDIKGHWRRGWPVWLLGAMTGGLFVALSYALFVLFNIAALALGIAYGDWLVFGLVLGAGTLLELILGSATTVWLSSALLQVEQSGDGKTAFQRGRVRPYARANAKRILWTALRFVPVALVAGLMGASACAVGLLPALVLIQMAAMHLRWQIDEHHRAERQRETPPVPQLEDLHLPSEKKRVAALPPRRRVFVPPPHHGDWEEALAESRAEQELDAHLKQERARR